MVDIDKVYLYWSSVPGESIEYIIKRNGNLIINTTDTSYIDYSVESNSIYNYEIFATNNIGESEESIGITIDTSSPDYPKESESILSLVNLNEITLWWDQSTGPGDSIWYSIYRNDEFITDIEDTLFIDNSISPSTIYHYDIFTNNIIGSSIIPASIISESWPLSNMVNKTNINSIYPNPIELSHNNTLSIILDSKGNINTSHITLYDIRGREIKRWEKLSFSKGRQRLELNNLISNPISNGMYFITFDKDYTIPLIIFN